MILYLMIPTGDAFWILELLASIATILNVFVSRNDAYLSRCEEETSQLQSSHVNVNLTVSVVSVSMVCFSALWIRYFTLGRKLRFDTVFFVK